MKRNDTQQAFVGTAQLSESCPIQKRDDIRVCETVYWACSMGWSEKWMETFQATQRKETDYNCGSWHHLGTGEPSRHPKKYDTIVKQAPNMKWRRHSSKGKAQKGRLVISQQVVWYERTWIFIVIIRHAFTQWDRGVAYLRIWFTKLGIGPTVRSEQMQRPRKWLGPLNAARAGKYVASESFGRVGKNNNAPVHYFDPKSPQ